MKNRNKTILTKILVICFVLIACSGFSFLMPFRIAIIALFGISMVLDNMKGSSFQFYKSHQSFWFLIFVLLMVIGIFYSFDRVETIKFTCVYLVGLVMILTPMKENFHYNVFGLIEICVKVIAISIILNLFIPHLFSNYLYLFISGGSSAISRLNNEVNNQIYSGLMGEKGEAAYIMVIAIIQVFSKCAADKKVTKKNGIWLCIFFIALLLPAKRMLFVIGILFCMLYIMFWTSGKKRIYSIVGLGTLASIGYIVVSKIPALNKLMERFVTYSYDTTANGRGYLWERAFEMYTNKPWLGYGYGSFNAYASYNGVILTSTREWISQAHNIYIQLLGEMGIIGTIAFLVVAICGVRNFLQVYRRKSNLEKNDYMLLFFGGSIQILTFLYGLSGNCIYYTNQIMLYFWSLALMVFLQRKYARAHTKIRRNKYVLIQEKA